MAAIKTSFFVIGIFLSATIFAQNGIILKDDGLNKLSVFLGTWQSKNNPASDDNTSAVYTCRWSVNKEFLVCDQIVTHKDGQTNNLAIYSYDSLNNYKLTLVGIPGVEPFSIPVISSGDSLIYPGSHMENGMKVYNRTVNIFSSNTLYKYFIQSSKDGINWITSLEGKATKIRNE